MKSDLNHSQVTLVHSTIDSLPSLTRALVDAMSVVSSQSKKMLKDHSSQLHHHQQQINQLLGIIPSNDNDNLKLIGSLDSQNSTSTAAIFDFLQGKS